jgi:ADP-ribosylglycohydrolase
MTINLEDRILGCLLGVAIGDALGMPTSFMPPQEIKERYGQIAGFEAPPSDHIYHAGYKPGRITDDTEQTVYIARALLESRRADPQKIADCLLDWFEEVGGAESAAVGPSSMAALTGIRAGQPIELAGRRGHTNGAAMRISPVGILHAGKSKDIEAIIRDVYLVSMPTHGSTLAISGAGALACGIACALQGSDMQEVVRATHAGAVIGERTGFPVIGPSISRRIDIVVEIVKNCSDLDTAANEIYQVIGAGVEMEQSVPAAIGLFLAADGDPKRTLLAAANMGGDCDTVASMAGALAGAYAGTKQIPTDWSIEIENVNHLNLAALAAELYAATSWWGTNQEE